MIHIPVLRWGEHYDSMDKEPVVHFSTGETLCQVSQANGGIVERDMKKAKRARDILREIPVNEILKMMKKAGDLYTSAELPLGDGTQTPDDFAKMQSATTGLPEHMCRFNMEKNKFVLDNMEQILDSLTRGLDLSILTRGHGIEERGVPISYQAESPVLGMVLPSNSPGVHTLWLPIIPLQVGLVLKPGPQEPWTPYRMTQAFISAGIPKEAISIYPGLAEVGAAVLNSVPKSLIFGSTATVERYKGNPGVQVHGPGFSKIILGDDKVDDWEKYLDIMVDSVLINSGRGCINCSGVWASRHTKEIAQAIAEKIGPVQPLPPEDANAALAAFTVPGQAEAISASIDKDAEHPQVTDMTTEKFGSRLVQQERCDYLRPTVIHCASTEPEIVYKEYMFPFVTVVECPEKDMLKKIGPTLVCSLVSENEKLQRDFIDAHNIDRLNIGAMPTIKLNWLQPHEGSIVDFLFRGRAFQHDELCKI